MNHIHSSSRRAAIAALPRLVLRRAFSEKAFISLRLIGLTIAVAVSAGVFIYLDALGQSALSQSLAGHPQQDLDIAIRARNDSISDAAYQRTIELVRDSRSHELAKVLDEPIVAAKSVTLVFDREVVPWQTARTFLRARRRHARNGDAARRELAAVFIKSGGNRGRNLGR